MTRRILQLSDGYAFVVSDLQGNVVDFERTLKLYYECKESGNCKYLLICGDLIHGYTGYHDESFSMLQKVIDLCKKDSDIILLMGNHELAHVMHWNLKKRDYSFTEDLEKQLQQDRFGYWQFLHDLPFAVFTKGGLVINHTGPSKALAGKTNELWDLFFKINSPWKWYNELDFEKSFGMLQDQKDFWNPDFGERTLETAEGKILWEVFMNKNELQYGEEYYQIVENFLITMNKLAPAKVIISGHIEESEGFKLVHEKHFRLCSSYGASLDESKKYLLLPVNKQFNRASELKPFLCSLW
tara:strand:- start:484 stop:1377 length:894 start_codon:yes stop_codon:yes gene_type:complete